MLVPFPEISRCIALCFQDVASSPYCFSQTISEKLFSFQYSRPPLFTRPIRERVRSPLTGFNSGKCTHTFRISFCPSIFLPAGEAPFSLVLYKYLFFEFGAGFWLVTMAFARERILSPSFWRSVATTP